MDVNKVFEFVISETDTEQFFFFPFLFFFNTGKTIVCPKLSGQEKMMLLIQQTAAMSEIMRPDNISLLRTAFSSKWMLLSYEVLQRNCKSFYYFSSYISHNILIVVKGG